MRTDSISLPKGKEALARLDEEAMMIMRARSARTHNVGVNHENEEQFAARALYDAVVYNTPWLLSGDDSRHALTISKELFSTPSNRCGDWPGFDIVRRAVRVQDYRAMKLAGPLYEK
ncbi:hypothetical protein [Pseudomonas viridiflava]|uniref:hypothetical protein n=1 Tax=Pseudomonas viridiflava TaxID=33069 RepID=UPI000F0475DB|nr:hypothetical protein [Pseudomonas viridiflava]